MRPSPAEKRKILRLVEESELGVWRTLRELSVPRSSFYRWYRAYRREGAPGLEARPPARWRFWNRIPEAEREKVVVRALARPERRRRFNLGLQTRKEELILPSRIRGSVS